jgi:hypothetical protein
MATNDTTSDSANLSVPGDRPSDASNYCALDATLRLCRRRERESKKGGAKDKFFHGFSPECDGIISEVKLGSAANQSVS